MTRRLPSRTRRARLVALAASLWPLLALAAADPYPFAAAGWGPELGGGRMASRWAEPLPDGERFAWRAELRLRHAAWRDAPGRVSGTTDQGQLRAVLGADWRPLPALRVYGEVASGQVDGDRAAAPPNVRNALAVQQLFVEWRDRVGPVFAGVMAGRQEFADGPRQLLSLSDGPNLHRSWNGLRGYVHARRWRLGAFALRATQPGPGGFDERIDGGTRLRGLIAGVALAGDRAFLEPFWLHSTQPAHRIAGVGGQDARDSLGLRAWGKHGAFAYDATVVHQSGRTVGARPVDAWGLFLVGRLALPDTGWTPKLSLRLDLGSGGGAWGEGTVRTFHPLYASSGYVSEGQLLSLANLAMLTPGLTVSPTPRTTLSLELGHARRLAEDDAVYATAARGYAGTQAVPGTRVGELLRFGATWTPNATASVRLNLEHLRAGPVLRRAGQGSASFAFIDLTLRH